MFKINIPTREECISILKNNKTPSNVIEHSKAVCRVAEEIADNSIQKGRKVNKDLVIAGALLHDVERLKEDHVAAGANLIKRLGFPEVSEVIRKHSLYKLEEEEKQPGTFEEKIVFYADKRCTGNNIVTLKERFDALEKHYKIDLSEEFELAKKIENELLQ